VAIAVGVIERRLEDRNDPVGGRAPTPDAFHVEGRRSVPLRLALRGSHPRRRLYEILDPRVDAVGVELRDFDASKGGHDHGCGSVPGIRRVLPFRFERLRIAF
jgi:hypothetical protein